MRIFATLGAAVLLGWACGGSYFTCADDTQCVQNGVQGTCIVSADVCAFPDGECPSGLRFGDHGPPRSPTGCVPEEGANGSSGGSGEDSGGTTPLDTGTAESDANPSDPSTGSESAVCGDGQVQGDEPCDDGNREDGDGCDEGCVVSGSPRWLLVLGEPGAATERGRDLVLDGDLVRAIGTASGDVVLHSVSLDGDLDSSWSYDAPAGGEDTGNGIALLSTGRLALAGTVTSDAVHAWMAAWDPETSDLAWQIEGPIGDALRVAAASDGTVYAVGSDLSGAAGVAWIASAFAGTPGVNFSAAVSSRADAVIVDAGDRVLVGGSLGADYSGPLSLWEFSGTAFLPLVSEAGRFGTGDVQAIAVADNGDLVVGGWITTANERDMWLGRRTPDGSAVWSYEYSSGVAGLSDEIEGVAVTPEGDVIAVGFRTAATAADADLWVARFTAEGDERWIYTYDHEGGFDVGRAVVVGPDGDLYVVGELETATDGALGRDMFVARLAP